MELINWGARLYIAITFAAAAVGKVRTGELTGTLRVMGLPEVAIRPLSRLLVAIEAVIAVAIWFSATWPIVAPLTVCLVLCFMAVGISFRNRGIPCACFGSLTRGSLGWSTVWKNIPLLLAAVLVWLKGGFAMSDLLVVSHIVQWVLLLLVAGGLLVMQRRISGTHAAPIAPPAPAAGIEVHTLGGDVRTLFARSERRRLVIVTAVGCKYCSWVYAQFKEIQALHPDVQVSVLVAANSAADVRESMGAHAGTVDPLWLPFNRLGALGVNGFPSGIVVSPEGQVLTSGVVPTLAHVSALLSGTHQAGPQAAGALRPTADYVQ